VFGEASLAKREPFDDRGTLHHRRQRRGVLAVAVDPVGQDRNQASPRNQHSQCRLQVPQGGVAVFVAVGIA
jgi:hypothetical protein